MKERRFFIRNGVLRKYRGTESDGVIAEVPEGVEEIADEAFAFCKWLEKVVLPSTLKKIGEKAFFRCYNLAQINIPKGVKEIGRGAFYNCYPLEGVVLPSGMSEISEYAFYGCGGLESATLPCSIKTIGAHAFDWCSIVNFVYEGTKEQWAKIEKGEKWDTFAGVYKVHCSDGSFKRERHNR